ncbi:MAG: PDZ domain-containing protein [Anaerolineales bacterium]|nr:PDZ domain-containing protein [Anaerolineales bacterium]
MRRLRLPLLVLLAATLACNTLLPRPTATPRAPTPTGIFDPPRSTPTPASGATSTKRVPTRQPIATVTPAEALTPEASGARACDFVPGVSVPAVMPPGLGAPTATPPPPPIELPPNIAVDADVTAAQLDLYDQFTADIENEYVYPDFNGADWPAIQARYRALIEGGLTDDDFYYALNLVLYDLGDDHSYFESPVEAAQADQEFAGNIDYVGIGVVVEAVPEAGRATIVYTFPGGAAAEAGLRAHDSLLTVDGEPILDDTGGIKNIIRGEAGSEIALTVQRPGGEPFDLTLVRRRITGATPVDYCLMPAARVGYIFLPHLDDETIPDQFRAALDALTADAPLAGLIIDNRQNGGGANTVLEALLGLFLSGPQGFFVSRDATRPFDIQAEERDGSQAVPLVVLVGPDTVSYGEIMTGVLQAAGRATVLGQTSLGNVETMWAYTYPGGARAWIAHETFQYPGQAAGQWEDTGIIPDIPVPTRWDLFTEADDPALAAALVVFGLGQ